MILHFSHVVASLWVVFCCDSCIVTDVSSGIKYYVIILCCFVYHSSKLVFISSVLYILNMGYSASTFNTVQVSG